MKTIELDKSRIRAKFQIGKHNKVADVKFDKKELKLGIKIEMEHTDDPEIAKSIAKDHLSECKDYYTRLLKLERACKA
jgi:hypothetical protein